VGDLLKFCWGSMLTAENFTDQFDNYAYHKGDTYPKNFAALISFIEFKASIISIIIILSIIAFAFLKNYAQ
jgi:hypothetical protein